MAFKRDISTGWLDGAYEVLPMPEDMDGSAEQSRRRDPGIPPFDVCAECGGTAEVGVTAERKLAEAINGALCGCGSGRGVG